jgi:hypothetical protein
MKLPRRLFLHLAAGAAAMAAVSRIARAQAYPSRPVRIVVPVAAGGATDVMAIGSKQMAIGRKTGGRRKGTPNRRTAEMRAEMAATGELPLDYMLRVMRDETADPVRRDAMAKAAAPYLHLQLQSTRLQHTNPDGTPIGPQITEVFLNIENIEQKPGVPAVAETVSSVSDRRH